MQIKFELLPEMFGAKLSKLVRKWQNLPLSTSFGQWSWSLGQGCMQARLHICIVNDSAIIHIQSEIPIKVFLMSTLASVVYPSKPQPQHIDPGKSQGSLCTHYAELIRAVPPVCGHYVERLKCYQCTLECKHGLR